MKKWLLSCAGAAALLSAGPVWAADEHTFAFNVGAVTDYRYRGISQSRQDPALQGGIDYSHASGFYLGTWASTIKWIKDAGTINNLDAGDTDFEWDLYGGYKGSLMEGLGFDVGVLAYFYPGNHYENVPGGADADTTELYGALSYGPGTLKYSHSVTNLFGNANSKNSGYLDLSATFDIYQGVMLTPHIGHQKVKNVPVASYTDYSLTVSKDFSGLVLSLAAVGTDADEAFYVTPEGRFTGRAALVLGVKYNF